MNFKQGDVTAGFTHADILDNEKVYVEMSRGFEQLSKNGRKKDFETEKYSLWYPSESMCLLEILDKQIGSNWSEAVKI